MEELVYEYLVCWQAGLFEYEWKHKFFANKKEAQLFAKKHKNKKRKPYPYIIQLITTKSSFREDVKTEPAKARDCEPSYFRRFIKY